MNDSILEGAPTRASKPQDNRVPASPGAASWLPASGGMADRIRAHDWEATPLGSLPSWPQNLRTLVDLMLGSRQPVCIVWGASLILLYNDSFASTLGIGHPAALGMPYRDVWPDMWDRQRPLVDSMMAGEKQYVSGMAAEPDGQGEWTMGGLTFSWAPVRDEAGRVAGFFCSGAETIGSLRAQTAPGDDDIIMRKRAEEARRESEERLRQVQEAARIGSFEFDRATGHAIASPEYLELYGLAQDHSEVFSYNQWILHVHPEDRARIEAETRAAVADPARHQIDYEFRIFRADTGEMRWITARTKLIRDAGGASCGRSAPNGTSRPKRRPSRLCATARNVIGRS